MNSNFSSNVLAEKQCIMLCWGASSDGGCTGIAWRKKPCYYYFLSNGGDPRRRSKSGCFMVVCFARKKKFIIIIKKYNVSYLIVYFNLLAAL